MAKKKMPQTETPTKPSRHKEPRESFHLSQQMQEALEAFVEQSDTPTDKSKICRKALEDFLRRRGFWPWPQNQG